MVDKNNNAALQSTLQYLEKKHGKGIIMKLGDKTQYELPTISTGSLKLDFAMGTGGFTCGRMAEIFGPEASGKTTLAMHAMAQAQQKGEVALLVDTEHAFDKNYAKELGIDVQSLLVCQPDHGEQALDVVETCVRGKAVGIVVVDSVSALIPEAELKGEMGDQNVAGQARLMSKALRKLTAIISKTGVVAIFINQLRHKIGMVFGSPEVTPGGNALKYYTSLRLDVRNVGVIKNKEGIKIGQKIRIRIVKNKLASPFKEVVVDLMYGKGISQIAEIVDISLSLGILKKSGAWFFYDKKQLGQGREYVIHALAQDAQLKSELKARIIETTK